MKLFSWNCEILAPCCDVIISELGKNDSNLHIKYNCRKKIIIRNYNNFGSRFFFWWQNFWILKHRPSLWRHYSQTETIRTVLTSEMRFSLKLQEVLITNSAGFLTEELLSRISIFTEHHYWLIIDYKCSSILQ